MWKFIGSLIGIAIIVFVSPSWAAKKTFACDLVEVKAASFWRSMQWMKSCPDDRASKYVLEILPLKSKLMQMVFRKHDLQGGGPTVVALVETLVAKEKLFPIEIKNPLVRFDDESEALRITLVSEKELEISMRSIIPALSDKAHLERLIGEANKSGILE